MARKNKNDNSKNKLMFFLFILVVLLIVWFGTKENKPTQTDISVDITEQIKK